MAKKDMLKNSLVRKKPVIGEKEAQKVVEIVHVPDAKEEETVKTSVDFRKSLYRAMKIRLIDEGKTMRDYLEALIEADLNK